MTETTRGFFVAIESLHGLVAHEQAEMLSANLRFIERSAVVLRFCNPAVVDEELGTAFGPISARVIERRVVDEKTAAITIGYACDAIRAAMRERRSNLEWGSYGGIPKPDLMLYLDCSVDRALSIGPDCVRSDVWRCALENIKSVMDELPKTDRFRCLSIDANRPAWRVAVDVNDAIFSEIEKPLPPLTRFT